MIRFENVTKVYPRSTRPAISDVTVDIDRGEFVFVVGASGSGKSTMLRLALREEAATEGTVLVAGHDLGSMAMRQVPCCAARWGGVPGLPPAAQQASTRTSPTRCRSSASRGTSSASSCPRPSRWSASGARRSASPTSCPAVSSSASRSRGPSSTAPRSCLCDEPIGNLDQAISLDIVRLLDRINRTGTTIVMATHDHDIVNDLRRRVIQLRRRHGRATSRTPPTTPRRRTEPQPRFLPPRSALGLRRNISMAVSVVLVTMVSMFLLGLGLLAQRQADTMKGYWYDRIQVSIYLCTPNSLEPNCENWPSPTRRRPRSSASSRPCPRSRRSSRVGAGGAFERFKEQFRNSPISGNVQVGDIPQSLQVQLTDPTKFEVVTQQFEGAPGVALVQDQEKVLSKFFTIINYITVFAVMLAALMAACAALLMATTIRQAASSGAGRSASCARRRVELDDPDAVRRRDGHRLGRVGWPSGCSSR